MQKTAVVSVLLISLLLGGCSSWKQSLNQFQSSAYLGYVQPPTEVDGKLFNPAPPKLTVTNPMILSDTVEPPLQINKGDKIVVDLMGGYLHDIFESWLARKTAIGRLRNELVVIIAVHERTDSSQIAYPSDAGVDMAITNLASGAVHSGNATSQGKFIYSGVDVTPTNAEYNILFFNGQLAKRPFGIQTLPIYGPKTYHGGDLVFQIAIGERDGEEYKALLDDTTTILGKVKEEITPKEGDQKNLYALAGALAMGTVKLSNSGVVLMGIEAIQTVTKLYADLHGADDMIMEHSFTLTSPYRSANVPAPVLRKGYYPLIRLSTKLDHGDGLSNVTWDPFSRKEQHCDEKTGAPTSHTWLSFTVNTLDIPKDQ